MKTIYLTALIVVLILLSVNKSQSQTTLVQLNQVELMKQFLGTWQAEIGKDTIQLDEYTAFGSAVVASITNSTKGKVFHSVKELWGYDEKTDKIVFAVVTDKSPNMILNAFWFTSNNNCEGVPYADISAPEKAAMKYKMEIKNSDVWVLKVLQNNNKVAEMTFKRVKK